MDYQDQKHYFEIAYRTGSDVWTHIPYHHIALRILPPLGENAMVLDVGAGRGLWMGKLVADGNRVIGLEYLPEVVKKGNEDVKLYDYADRARFILGDVRDIPLTDNSFDAVTDIGLLQHLDTIDWHQYMHEIHRVLKQGGYVLNVSLSKETARFMGFRPKTSPQIHFEKFGVTYHFFSNDEINALFAHHGFSLIEQKIEHFEPKTDPGDSLALVFSLYKKD